MPEVGLGHRLLTRFTHKYLRPRLSVRASHEPCSLRLSSPTPARKQLSPSLRSDFSIFLCRRWDLNPQALRQRVLNPPRIPFRHSGNAGIVAVYQAYVKQCGSLSGAAYRFKPVLEATDEGCSATRTQCQQTDHRMDDDRHTGYR